MKKPNIVLINGSPFRNGNAAKAGMTALSAAKQTGASVRVIHLPNNFPHCDGRRPEKHSLAKRFKELPRVGGLPKLMQTMLDVDGIIVTGSTNCFNAPSRSLAALAWGQVILDYSDNDDEAYPLKGKVVALMSVCEEDGAQGANEKMVSPANHLGLILPPFCMYFYNKFAKESEGDWQETDRTLVGLNVRRMVQVLRGEIPVGDWNDSDIGSW